MMGQVATLGQHKGVAEVLGLRLHGWPGWWVTRTYHLYQLPLPSRKLRVVSDWTVGLFFRRDVVELGSLGTRDAPASTPACPRLTGLNNGAWHRYSPATVIQPRRAVALEHPC